MSTFTCPGLRAEGDQGLIDLARDRDGHARAAR